MLLVPQTTLPSSPRATSPLVGDLLLLAVPGSAGGAADGAVQAQDAVGCGDTLGWSRSTAGAVWQRRNSVTEGAVSEMRHMFTALAAAAGSFGKTQGTATTH